MLKLVSIIKYFQVFLLSGAFGLYYNYNKEHIFVPGRTDFTIVPTTDAFGTEENTIREGVNETTNYFYNLNARYNKQFSSRHALNAMAGVQILTTLQEYDGAYARNTTNDFYQVLGSADAIGRYFDGYQNKWNWANIYGHVDYTYNHVLNAALNMSIDGSSANGRYTNHFRVYPSGGITWMAKNMSFLIDKDWITRLDLRAEYSLTETVASLPIMENLIIVVYRIWLYRVLFVPKYRTHI